jgi:DNA mismatch repair protein MSH3
MLEAESNKAFLSFLSEIIDDFYTPLRNAVNKLALADCILSMATVASQEGYVKPVFTSDDTIEIIDGRHPMAEVLRTDPYVPNSVYVGGGSSRTKMITGPNMGGKSSTVRMVALIGLMAQVGSYVPAASVKMGLLDAILTRMGGMWICFGDSSALEAQPRYGLLASDELARGRSTFMVEMSETSDILQAASSRSLVILDELGRGTSTFDGVCLSYNQHSWKFN